MKGYNTLYYLLFVMLIMGTFASMAQNGYGLVILGCSAIAFAALFLIQCIEGVIKKSRGDLYVSMELACLFVLSVIFAMRVFYIGFYYIEWVYGLAIITLICLYIRKMVKGFVFFKTKSNFLSLLILVYYAVIILYFLSLGFVAFLPQISVPVGAAAFVLLLLIVIIGLLKRQFLTDGEKTSVFRIVTQRRDNSILILSLFILFTLYKGFTTTGLVPKIYSDEFPKAYFDLVNKAEAGKEKPVDGVYRYQAFKDRYDEFVKKDK